MSISEGEVDEVRIKITKLPSGHYVVQILFGANKGRDFPLPTIYRAELGKLLIQIAEIDKNLYEFTERAYDDLATLEHVREMLINAEENVPESISNGGYMFGLADYALARLEEAENSNLHLYRACTGKDVIEGRIR